MNTDILKPNFSAFRAIRPKSSALLFSFNTLVSLYQLCGDLTVFLQVEIAVHVGGNKLAMLTEWALAARVYSVTAQASYPSRYAVSIR